MYKIQTFIITYLTKITFSFKTVVRNPMQLQSDQIFIIFMYVHTYYIVDFNYIYILCIRVLISLYSKF